MYLSQDDIKSVKIVKESSRSLEIILCDESKHLKRFEFYESQEKVKATQTRDYYIHNDFDGTKTDYAISDEMLYTGIDGYLLQDKENAATEKAIKCMPDSVGIDQEKIDYGFPK